MAWSKGEGDHVPTTPLDPALLTGRLSVTGDPSPVMEKALMDREGPFKNRTFVAQSIKNLDRRSATAEQGKRLSSELCRGKKPHQKKETAGTRGVSGGRGYSGTDASHFSQLCHGRSSQGWGFFKCLKQIRILTLLPSVLSSMSSPLPFPPASPPISAIVSVYPGNSRDTPA